MKTTLSVLVALSFVSLTSLASAAEVKDQGAFPADIQPIIAKRCLDCHAKAKFMKSPEAMKASDAAKKIKANRMPPKKAAQAKDFSDAEREALLNFLTAAPAK